MFCCISGHIPEEPVVSRSNGALYERRLIEAYIKEHNRDPKTGEPMMLSDLMSITGGVATTPRAVGATSIPGLLASLQGEWDALLLEQFSLRQQLATAQQELSHALYKHEAACRVIARLMRQRDEALKLAREAPGVDETQIASIVGGMSGDGGPATGDAADGNALPESICNEIDVNALRLKTERKRREISREVSTANEVKQFTEIVDLIPPHSSSAGSPLGMTCVAVSEIGSYQSGRSLTAGARSIFVGGNDGRALLFDVAREAVAATLIGHTKPVRKIQTADDFVVTCSDDGTTRVWRQDIGNYRCASILKGHQSGVNGFVVLPSHRHLLTAGADGCVNFHDIEAGVAIANSHPTETNVGINCIAMHPDGFMAATGSATAVHLWDIKGMDIDAQLAPLQGPGNISAIAFADDGVTMAVGSSMGVVQLWDLRKLAEPMHPLSFDDNAPSRPNGINDLAFDPSAQYLAIAANNAKIWHVKKLDQLQPHYSEQLTVLASHLAPVTGVAWGRNAKWLATTSSDRRTKVWGGL